VDDDAIRERIEDASDEFMATKAAQFGRENMRNIEKQLLLQTIDGKWREHLLTLEHLRSVIGFRGYAQRDPLNEYKTESFQLFETLLDTLRVEVSGKLSQIRPLSEEEQKAMIAQLMAQRNARRTPMAHAAPLAKAGTAIDGFDENKPEAWGDPGRNSPCPCGSGRKFKHCHGRIA